MIKFIAYLVVLIISLEVGITTSSIERDFNDNLPKIGQYDLNHDGKIQDHTDDSSGDKSSESEEISEYTIEDLNFNILRKCFLISTFYHSYIKINHKKIYIDLVTPPPKIS